MPKRDIAFVPGAHYHVFNRGVERRDVFMTAEHYWRFTELMIDRTTKYAIQVSAYCLLPNHFHLLIRPEDEGTVSKFMQGLCSSYVQYINRRLERIGPLFQGRFRALPVDEGPSLAYVSRYVHRNPVEAGLVDRPEDWPHSNFMDIATEQTNRLNDGSIVPGQFETGRAYQEYVEAEHFPEVAIRTSGK